MPTEELSRGARAAPCPRRARFASSGSKRGRTGGRRYARKRRGAAAHRSPPRACCRALSRVRRRARAGDRRARRQESGGTGRKVGRDMAVKGSAGRRRGDAHAEMQVHCLREYCTGLTAFPLYCSTYHLSVHVPYSTAHVLCAARHCALIETSGHIWSNFRAESNDFWTLSGHLPSPHILSQTPVLHSFFCFIFCPRRS